VLSAVRLPLAKSELLLSEKWLPCLPIRTAIGMKSLHAWEEHAAIPYGPSNAGATWGLCLGLPVATSRCVFHPCWRVMQRQHAPSCPYPGSDRQRAGVSQWTPIISFTLHRGPSALSFTSCLLLQLYRCLFRMVPTRRPCPRGCVWGQGPSG